MGQRVGQKQGPRGMKERELGVAGRPWSHREERENELLSSGPGAELGIAMGSVGDATEWGTEGHRETEKKGPRESQKKERSRPKSTECRLPGPLSPTAGCEGEACQPTAELIGSFISFSPLFKRPPCTKPFPCAFPCRPPLKPGK